MASDSDLTASNGISHTYTIPWYDTSEIPYHPIVVWDPEGRYHPIPWYGREGQIPYHPISFRPVYASNRDNKKGVR